MTYSTLISGWGNYSQQEAQLLTPSCYPSLITAVKKERGVIARGMGRSYGDSANAPKVLHTSFYDHFVEFDDKRGVLTAEAGVTLREILKVTLHKGWFLPVTPGTSFITLGGAIASDVHGKNHHNAGTFGQHVICLKIMLGTGEIVTASYKENIDLFYATCGGMGLTGIILSATIQLISVRSSLIKQKIIKANCIEAACEAFEENRSATYSVAWIDCLAKREKLGRSVLMLGEHSEDGGFKIDVNEPFSVPFNTPSAMINNMTMTILNSTYWHKAKHRRTQVLPLMSYFYPLDIIGNWNRLYGKPGFLQFQCVLPKDGGIANMRRLLTEITNKGEGSFLAVLKQFGRANNNYLSFPIEGYTLALDFKLTPSVILTLQRLEELTLGMGGKIYLTKDAVMKETTFKATYPNWEKFQAVREKYGAIGKFRSAQSIRLGLS